MVVYDGDMPTKTITLELDAYERLKAAKRSPRESFSEVVRRLPIPGHSFVGRDLLKLREERGAYLTDEEAAAIDAVNRNAESRGLRPDQRRRRSILLTPRAASRSHTAHGS